MHLRFLNDAALDMTEEDIKEALSRSFVRLVANRAGYSCKVDERDYGIDITVAEVRRIRRPAGNRLLETGRYVNLQLKTTCHSTVVWEEEALKYDLEVKTYNDLVDTWRDPVTPLWLVLFVLPDAAEEWLSLNDEDIILRRNAFYWKPEPGTTRTENTSRIRVSIPLASQVTLSFVHDRYEEFYS